MLKKFTSWMLALVMVVTLISVTPTSTDAAIKILLGKKLNLSIGKKDDIIVKGGGATFKSSNTKVATVNAKGKVKAVGAGTCKITVTKAGESVKTTVKVTPAKVNNVEVTTVSGKDDAIQVSWDKVKKVKGYNIYISTQKKKGFKKAATVKGAKKTTATIDGLAAGTTYYVKVKAYAKAGKKKIESSKYSAVASVKTWKLVWNDEFNGTTLDRSKWDFQLGGGGFGNDELQTYTDSNYKMDGSNFVITPQITWNKATNKAETYKSTKIWTKGIYSVKYGKIEFRAKLPKGKGTWAAAWMLGDVGTWPMCGEIDILETTSQLAKTTIPQSIHCQKFNGMSSSSGNKYRSQNIPDATSAYHTYGIIWTETEITFTVDGKATWTYDPALYSLDDNPTGDATVWPYDNPFYLILNCAIGGTLGGTVGTDFWTLKGTNGNIQTYEDYYYVDWVRVYQ